MYQAFTLFVKITAQLSLLRNDFTTGRREKGRKTERKPEIERAGKERGRGEGSNKKARERKEDVGGLDTYSTL
jgi:hypothetical protein